MKQAGKLFTLRNSDLFESFSAVELGRLLGILEEQELPKHHVIFSPGAPCEDIYFIEKGRVRMTKLSPDGKMIILALLGPGDLIGEAAWE
ncbi:MAG TPA: cyclic nucleotide-binding domain-containing protein, partial [Candidatus Obscuribacterales bacterium]